MNVRREWTASSGYRCNFLGIFRGFVAGKERDPVSPRYAGVSPGSAAGKTARIRRARSFFRAVPFTLFPQLRIPMDVSRESPFENGD